MDPVTNQTVELIADAVPTAQNPVPTGLATTPFDVMIGPLPLFVYVEVFCAIALIVAVFYWVSRMKSMSDVSNYRKCDGSNILLGNPILGFKLSDDLHLSIQSMQYSAGCVAHGVDQPDNRSIWILNSKDQTAVIGGVPSVFLSDRVCVVRDLPCESAFALAIAEYNSHMEDPRDHILSFRDWQEFGRRALQAIAPGGINVPTYRQLNPSDIDKLMPKKSSSAFFGSMLWMSASELATLDNTDNGFFARYGAVLAVAGIVIIAMIGVFFIPL